MASQQQSEAPKQLGENGEAVELDQVDADVWDEARLEEGMRVLKEIHIQVSWFGLGFDHWRLCRMVRGLSLAVCGLKLKYSTVLRSNVGSSKYNSEKLQAQLSTILNLAMFIGYSLISKTTYT